MGDLHSYLSQTPEQREKAKKDKEFEKWAKSIQPGWVPKLSELQDVIRK